jgi:ABC-type phosphate/phosphonate transport system substrate-binding protein
VPDAIESDVLFTQVCGYPLQTVYKGQAALLGAPVYAVEGCKGTTHTGVFIVAADSKYQVLADLRGCKFVYNSRHSNSGMNLPRRAIADLKPAGKFFASIEETHSQPANIERIAKGEADATCVDCVTYAFFCRHRPGLAARTRILCATPPSPSIPFVTSVETPVPLLHGLQAALLNVARLPRWQSVREGLMLRDIQPISMAPYAVQLAYEAEAKALRYPELM